MQVKTIENKIKKLKRDLQAMGEMRPGSLSQQYNVCGKPGCQCKDPKTPKKHGPYYQLSYVHKGKSTSQFIRPNFVERTEKQIANYKRFKRLTEEWIHLALEHSKLQIEMAKRDESKQLRTRDS